MNITIQGVDITLTPEQLEKLQAKIAPKQTAEEFLLEILNKPFETKLREGYITHSKDGEWMFEQDLKNKTLWVRWSLIWGVLEERFGLNYSEIQQLIRDVVLKPLNCEGFTPTDDVIIFFQEVCKPLNCEGFTPI